MTSLSTSKLALWYDLHHVVSFSWRLIKNYLLRLNNSRFMWYSPLCVYVCSSLSLWLSLWLCLSPQSVSPSLSMFRSLYASLSFPRYVFRRRLSLCLSIRLSLALVCLPLSVCLSISVMSLSDFKDNKNLDEFKFYLIYSETINRW